MKTKLRNLALTTGLALGTVMMGLAVTSQSALSFTLNFAGSRGPGEAPPPEFDPKLFSFEARAGAPGDFVGAIGPNGADAQNTGQYYFNWIDGNPVPWILNWDKNTGTVDFTFAGQTRSYDSPFDEIKLNGISLLAQAKNPGSKLDNNTTITVDVDTVNGEAVVIEGGPPFSATSQGNSGLSFPDNFEHNFYSTEPGEEIVSMTGTITLDWATINPQKAGARGRVTVQIKGYDPVFPFQELRSTPESNSIAGLLVFSAFAFTVATRKNESY